MTASDLEQANELRATYKKIVKFNCKKTYAKVVKILQPHKCCHYSIMRKLCHFTDPWSFSLFTNNNIYI